MMKARIAASDGPQESPAPPHCDFRTVEYGLGAIPKNKKWESCRGLGLAFGYNREELPSDYMTGAELIAMHRDVTSKGGNLLINVGPMADATIPRRTKHAADRTRADAPLNRVLHDRHRRAVLRES